jgi:hypothetical protein
LALSICARAKRENYHTKNEEQREETTRALALELGEDPDMLLAMVGKVSGDLQEIIRKRPQLFAQLIREMKNMPERAVLRLVREVRDGNW